LVKLLGLQILGRPKLLRLKLRSQILLVCGHPGLLVGQGNLQSLLRVEALRLELGGQILHARLLIRVEVGQRGLKAGLGAKLLHSELGLKVLLRSPHAGRAVALKLRLGVLIGRLQAASLNVPQLQANLPFALGAGQQVGR
jgi:hypothetical protein